MNTFDLKSTAFCLPAIANMLSLANFDNQPWQTNNDTQVRYFEKYERAASDIDSLAPYLKGKVTSNTAELNAWFAEHGWNIDVNIPPGGVGIGSIFNLLVNWLIPGIKKEVAIYQDNNFIPYDGVEMSRSEGLRAHKLPGYGYPMFELDTTEGWKVFIVEALASCEPFELPSVGKKLLSKDREPYSFQKLRFPIVEFETSVDISWMAGLSTKESSYIHVAEKKVRLRFDEKGAQAESAILGLATRRAAPSVYKIDKPFFVIFWRDGLEFPAFTALTAPDSWVKSR